MAVRLSRLSGSFPLSHLIYITVYMNAKLLSAFACSALLSAAALSSCQNNGDEPPMPVPTPNVSANGFTDAVKDYDGEMITRTLKVSAPDGLRTRAGDEVDGTGFLWNKLSEGKLYLDYAIFDYDKSYNLIFRQPTDIESETGEWNLSVSYPANLKNPQIIIWAAKTDRNTAYISLSTSSNSASLYSHYYAPDIRLENLRNSLGSTGDGFLYYGAMPNMEETITLKRPFAQILVLSDEPASVPGLQTAFPDGLSVEIGQTPDSEMGVGEIVIDPSIKFTSSGPSLTITSGGSLNRFNSYNWSSPIFKWDNMKTVEFNGKTMYYLGIQYMFAPYDNGVFQSSKNMRIRAMGKLTSKTILSHTPTYLDVDAPTVKANQRLILYHDSDNGGDGFFSKNPKFNVVVDDNFDETVNQTY